MSRPDIIAFVLAGGEGARLRPLTEHDAKPAVPFAHAHRIVDFVLGNLVNSRVSAIFLLAQYKPASLIEHVNAVWVTACGRARCGIDVILPDHCRPAAPFKGTAHAVHRCLHLLDSRTPDLVAVFAADHVYRMDVRQMAEFHLSHDADVTVAGIPVPLADARAFGIMATDCSGRIREFQEKPRRPEPMPGDPQRAYASMGNYLFKPAALAELLEQANRRGGTDFGAHIMPALPASGMRALAYDFARNELPGIQPYEDRVYWSDVGTLGALARARADVEGDFPHLDLRNSEWPIRRDLIATLPRRPSASSGSSGQHDAGTDYAHAA
jgi:glucose-1-phosphate adenylyltransferase